MSQSYSEILTSVLVHQSSNELFYAGNIDAGARSIVKEVVDAINADRASIWMFNKERDSIILQQLYIKSEDTFYQDIVLYKKDFERYFLALEENPIIIANEAETHHATSCFLESYLKPLGVKSMLDVPVWYKGSLIGVICIESLTSRSWKTEEIDFSQILSSLYSFAYSVNESSKLSKENQDLTDTLQTALNAAETSKEEAIVAKDEADQARILAEVMRVESEQAKNAALNDLDVIQKRSQTELISTIVKVALAVILSVGVITTIMYAIAMMTNKDTQIIGSTWSNMFGILLTNAFSIVGTIMGVKYASENKNNNQ